MRDLVKKYASDIDWNIGAFVAHDDFILMMVDICAGMGIKLPIKYVFGSIPCLFQGGRIAPRTADLENTLEIINAYNQRGIGVRVTFSSTLVQEEDLGDELCNSILKHLNLYKGKNVRNGAIVYSDTLAKYIKENYENIELISSQVKPSVDVGLGNDDIEFYNKLFDLYDIVVVNPVKVGEPNFLKELKHKDRVEFIVNHRCKPNCPMAGKHYKALDKLSRKMLIEGKDAEMNDEMMDVNEIVVECIKERKRFPLAGCAYSDDEINYLCKLGFKHFKLEGRDLDTNCFIRDMADYIFNYNYASRLFYAMAEGAV